MEQIRGDGGHGWKTRWKDNGNTFNWTDNRVECDYTGLAWKDIKSITPIDGKIKIEICERQVDLVEAIRASLESHPDEEWTDEDYTLREALVSFENTPSVKQKYTPESVDKLLDLGHDAYFETAWAWQDRDDLSSGPNLRVWDAFQSLIQQREAWRNG